MAGVTEAIGHAVHEGIGLLVSERTAMRAEPRLLTSRRNPAPGVRLGVMLGRPSSAEASALRALADQIDAGQRELSPQMAKALARELAQQGSEEEEALSAEDWERAWAAEIDRRLDRHRTGQSPARDLGQILESLRSSR